MAVGLQCSDEYAHHLAAPSNERHVFSFYDPDAHLGGLHRQVDLHLGGGDKLTSVSTCFFLPDGTVADSVELARDHDGVLHQPGPEVVRALEAVAFERRGCISTSEGPFSVAHQGGLGRLDYHMALELRTMSPPYVDLRRWSEDAGSYEHIALAEGMLRIGDRTWTISAPAIRQHRWGPGEDGEPSLALTGAAGSGFVFAARLDPLGGVEGFVWDGAIMHPLLDAKVRTVWSSHPRRPRDIRLSLEAGGRRWALRGRILAMLWSRPSPEDLDGEAVDGLVRWALEGGRVGHGSARYDSRMLAA